MDTGADYFLKIHDNRQWCWRNGHTNGADERLEGTAMGANVSACVKVAFYDLE